MTRAHLIDISLVGLAALAIIGARTVVHWRESSTAPRALFERRLVPQSRILLERGHHLGGKAVDTIVEFSDFQCPYCRRFHAMVDSLMLREPGTVAVVFRHFPGWNHFMAYPAAIASECAAQQGRFQEYASLLFFLQDSLEVLSFDHLAAVAGVSNLSKFQQCRLDPLTKERVDVDYREGKRIGIYGTPATVIGDSLIVGAMPIDTLKHILASRNAGRPR